jgi:RNA-directed DNA polymerase
MKKSTKKFKSIIQEKSLNLEWNKISWKGIQIFVQKFQKRIYSASRAGDIKKVRWWQNSLMSTYTAKLLAVRQVTQDNQGKKTAGIDGIKSLTPRQRLVLAKNLKLGLGSSPIRRVWIPKPGKTEKRPLGIPTIQDRALQALVKLALEPEWEARFEPNSYGFRPGRSCHDAMRAIINSTQKKAKYILDADIAKCFDRINHKALLNKLNLKGKLRYQIKCWLKAGILDAGNLTKSEQGTPQGGIISPLLTNIALHGMETRLKEFLSTQKLFYPGGNQMSKARKADTLCVVRYADDFVIMHDRLNIILKCKEIIIEFLTEIGLELSPSKTRITHTLKLSDQEKVEFGVEKPGFKFLGFEIRQFYSKHHSAFVANKPIGYRTLILPSNDKILAHTRRLALLIRKSRSLSQEKLIDLLNPIIRGWRNYYGVSHALLTGTFQKLDHLLYLKLRAWSKKKGKAKMEYWKTVGKNRWVFGPKNSPLELEKYSNHKVSLNDYIKVKGDASPYNGEEIYWAKRLGVSAKFSATQSKLLKAQKGKCALCQLFFNDDDIFEIDHIIPRSQGGRKGWENLQILHRHCHDTKSAKDQKGAYDKSIISE